MPMSYFPLFSGSSWVFMTASVAASTSISLTLYPHRSATWRSTDWQDFSSRITPAHALDVVHHRKAQRIRIDAGIALIVVVGLEHDAGMGVQELQHGAVGQQALVVQAVHDLVMDEGRATFVDHLGLFLRIVILRDV